MPFQLATTWAEHGHQLDQVKAKCNSIIAQVPVTQPNADVWKRGMDLSRDAREVGLVQIRQLGNTLAALYFRLSIIAEEKGGVRSMMQIWAFSRRGPTLVTPSWWRM